MIEESEQLMRTTAFRMSSVLTSESNPRDARLIARRSNGSALHTLDHQFSKSRAQKVPAQTPMLTGRPDPSQGASALAHTSPPPGVISRNPPQRRMLLACRILREPHDVPGIVDAHRLARLAPERTEVVHRRAVPQKGVAARIILGDGVTKPH